MTRLPRYDLVEVATKSDIAELRTELHDGLASVNQRLDRLYLTLLAGLFGVTAAMATVIFFAA